MAAVRLGRRADRVRPRWEAATHDAVLRLVGVVAVPGGGPDLGPRDGHAAVVSGRHLPGLWWGAGVRVDRQREDGDRRARRRRPGPPSRGGGRGPPLRPDDP